MTRAGLATAPLPAVPPVVDLRGVGFSYPGQQRGAAQHTRNGLPPPALSRVDLTISAGELVTLTGPAGSGKSTLLSVIGLLLRPTAGSYLLNGIDTARLGDRDRAALRAREIGIVSQPVQLLPSRTALDNAALPLVYLGAPLRLRRSVAGAALERVGLAAQANIPVRDLSADERQRVAIGRALVTEPGLVLCDDPTASLDPELAAQVIGLLTSLRSDGRTVLLATDDQLAAAYASRCIRWGDAGDDGPWPPR